MNKQKKYIGKTVSVNNHAARRAPLYKQPQHFVAGLLVSEQFHVKAIADCQTRNVVYLVEWEKCAIPYTGEKGKALFGRLTGHRSNLKHPWTDRLVAKHFPLPDHSMEDLSIMEIEKISREDKDFRRWKESHCIETIQLLTSDSLNLIP